jgi:hypothetical protein
VVANWNGDIILRRELRTDQRTFYRNALDHRVTVRLLERVASVPAECVGRVEHVTVEVESLDLEMVGYPGRRLAWCDRGAVAFAATAVPARAIATKSPAATARTRLPERMLSLFSVGNKAAFYFLGWRSGISVAP